MQLPSRIRQIDQSILQRLICLNSSSPQNMEDTQCRGPFLQLVAAFFQYYEGEHSKSPSLFLHSLPSSAAPKSKRKEWDEALLDEQTVLNVSTKRPPYCYDPCDCANLARRIRVQTTTILPLLIYSGERINLFTVRNIPCF